MIFRSALLALLSLVGVSATPLQGVFSVSNRDENEVSYSTAADLLLLGNGQETSRRASTT
jgi:hypothetical protein